jgi:mercuric ion binding protein
MLFRHFPLLLSLILAGSLQACQSAQAAQDGWDTAEIQTSAICNTCKMTLEKAFKDVEGVRWARLDLGNKVLTVKHDPEVIDLEGLRGIVTRTGYDADGQPGNAEAHDNLPYCCQKDSGVH